MDAIGRLVRDGTAVGTAFVVTADGLAATAAHLVRRTDAEWRFEPLTATGVTLPVRGVLAADPRCDVALLRIADADGIEPLRLGAHTAVPPGSPVHLRGFARDLEYDSGVGEVVGETAAHGRSWVKVSCRHAQPGMSGAPVTATGTGCVIGLVSARVNADRWNRDTVLLAGSGDIVALAPDRLRLVAPAAPGPAGTLRLSWDRGDSTEPVLETDDFTVSLGRNATNRIRLADDRDSRFHGTLHLAGTALTYHHLGARPAYLTGAARQVRIERGESISVADKDRLRFASGTLLVEFSAPDLFDPNAARTA